MSSSSLEDLNHRVVERLEYLDTFTAQQAMMALGIGAQVRFDLSRRGRVFGNVFKLNCKIVSVLTDKGWQWNVSLHLLSPIIDATLKQRFVCANQVTQE